MLPKTWTRRTLDDTFDRFFAFEDVAGENLEIDLEGEDGEDADSGEGEGDGQGGGNAQGERRGAGGGKGKSKKNRFLAMEEEEEEDLGPGEMANPHSALGKLLMQDSRIELTVQMANAGRAVNLERSRFHAEGPLHPTHSW